jgi:hypothetical protein
MITKLKWEWELLDEFTKRAKVKGGWLVHHGSHTGKGSISESMVLISDPDHQWVILKPVEEKPQPNKLAAADFKAPA